MNYSKSNAGQAGCGHSSATCGGRRTATIDAGWTIQGPDSNHCHSEQPADPTATRVIRVSGSMRDDRAIRVLQRCSDQLVQPGRRRVVVDLQAVDDADTKLVATLVHLLRRARSTRVVLQVLASSRVWDWIASCHVEALFGGGLPEGGVG